MQLEISRFKRIVVLTGAGISAESGISTFRDSNGLWERHRVEDVATPEAFERDPVLVWRFYSLRRRDAARAQPNAAHLALARFAKQSAATGRAFTLVSQNVDMLHERAAQSLAASAALPLDMHGTLSRSRCSRCDQIYTDLHSWVDDAPSRTPPQALAVDIPTVDAPPRIIADQIQRDTRGLPLSSCCSELLRPHIVWFGEMPLHMDGIDDALSEADLFVTIGSSGQVYPAAGFIERAKLAGATTACLNKEPLPQQAMVDFYLDGPAATTVPLVFSQTN